MLKVSIIIPVFNAAPYIIRCLESVYNQTYKNLEIIIIDDCGVDESFKLISEYLTAEQYALTQIIRHDINKGLSVARNTGINAATGEYVYFLDSDDYITSDCIESFILLVQKYNYPNAIFGSALVQPTNWNKTANIDANKPTIPEYSNDKRWIRSAFIKDNYIPITAWNKLIKRSHIIQHNLYFKEGIIYEDLLWNWILGNSLSIIVFNKKYTYYYCYSPNSITNKNYGFRNIDSETSIIKELSKNIKFSYCIPQIIYILHYCHSSFCRRQGDKPLPPIYIRYPKAFIFFIKCLFIKPEKLR